MKLLSVLLLLLCSESFFSLRPLRRQSKERRFFGDQPRENLEVPSRITKFSAMKARALFKGIVVTSSVLLRSKVSKAVEKSGGVCSVLVSNISTQINEPKEIMKRPRDFRDYKAFTLQNGLKVLVISDPTSSRSAAAIDVHVGSTSDPQEVPGIAHFCEHMSFLGTKKFPNEDEFSSFLSSHGGSSNAYTDLEDTVYYFDVNSQFLREALDSFSQFFIAPLFTASATSRELNAIDSEHAKNINSDGFRLYQLEKDSANPLHPLSKFSTGNKDTLEKIPKQLGIDTRQLLLDFHGAYYSANMMTLCVIGKQSATEMESWVRSLFSAIPNKGTRDPALAWWGKVQPFLPQKEASLLEVVPVGQARRIALSWPIWLPSPADRAALQVAKPEMVVSHLIGHEGAGSVRSYLVEKGWANAVSANIDADLSDLQVLEVAIDLTEEGFKHRYEVADVVFAYIALLQQQGAPDYIYDEVAQLSRINFDFSEKSEPSSYASSIVADMQVVPNPAEYLTGPRLYNPDPCAVANYLAQLTPAQARLKVISKDFQGKTEKEAKYYGTNYNNKTLPVQTKVWEQHAERLQKGEPLKYPLSVPLPNELIPRQFDLVTQPVPPTASEATKLAALNAPPTILRQDDRWTLWHKVDKSFGQPKIYAIFSLAIPAESYNEDFVMGSRLFSACFLDSINEYLYDARLAGLGFQLEFTSRGAQIVLSGYSDKISLFADRVLSALKNFKPNLNTFTRFRDLYSRELMSWRTQQPYSHCSYFASLASESLNFRIEDLVAALQRTSPESLNSFLLNAIGGGSYGTALIVGNIDEENAKKLVAAVEQQLSFTTLSEDKRSRRQPIEIPTADSAFSLASLDSTAARKIGLAAEPNTAGAPLGLRISRPEPNDQDANSAVTFYFQLPSRDPKEYLLVELLAEALEQPFYSSLRTKQQLGYIVASGVKSREGIYSLSLTVQSSILKGAELAQRVEAFLDEEVFSSSGVLSETGLTQELFDSFVEGMEVRKLEPDQRLTSQASRFWSELQLVQPGKASEKPQFSRSTTEVQLLQRITRKQLLAFAKEFLAAGGSRRRLLVSQVTSAQSGKNSIAEENITVKEKQQSSGASARYVEITDEAAFRQAMKVV